MKLSTSRVQPKTTNSSSELSNVRRALVCFALLFLLAFAAPAMAQLNESFESGIPGTWTVNGPAALAGTANSSSGLGPTQGSYYAWISNGCTFSAGTTCPLATAIPTPSYASLGLTAGGDLGAPSYETTLTSPSFTLNSPGGVVSFDVNFITTDGSYGFADFAMVQLVASDPAATNLFVANTTNGTSPAVPPVELTAGVGTMSPTTASFTGTPVTFGSITYGNVPKFGANSDPNCAPNTNTPSASCNGGPSAWIHVSFLAQPGTYQLVFLVSHVGDNQYPSALAIDNVQTSQTVTPGPIAPNQTTTATFDNTQGQNNIHTITLPANVAYQNGVTMPELLSTNTIVSNNGGIQPYVFKTPFASGLLFENTADDLAIGPAAVGFGSLIGDKCYEQGADPSTATFGSCPVSTPLDPNSISPADNINLYQVFDFPASAVQDIPPGTTVAMVHHPQGDYGPGTDVNNIPATGDWVPVASGAPNNPVCIDAQWDFINNKRNNCPFEDSLAYDPGITAQQLSTKWGWFGNGGGGGGGNPAKRGVFGIMNNILIPTTKLSVNGYALNSAGIQDQHGPYWFSAQSLSLDFLVNPACTGVNPLPALCSSSNNGWYAAPVLGEAYVFFNGLEPLLPNPPNCSDPRLEPAASTCGVKSGTPGEFTNGLAAPVEFTDTIPSASFSEGVVNTLAFTGKDTVTGERNIQLLHSGVCPNPNGIVPAPTPPCYSTSLFYELLGKDTTPPAITVTVPANGATYQLNQNVASVYSCSDASSGVSTCAGTVANGININTTTEGPKTFTVNATDNALPPNHSSANENYLVVNSATLFVGNFANFKAKTGTNLTYQIGVLNFGPGTAFNLAITNPLPAGTSFVSAVYNTGSCTFSSNGMPVCTSTQTTPCSFASNTVTCNIGSLAPFTLNNPDGAGVQLVVKVTASPGSSIADTASVSEANPNPNPFNSFTAITKVTK